MNYMRGYYHYRSNGWVTLISQTATMTLCNNAYYYPLRYRREQLYLMLIPDRKGRSAYVRTHARFPTPRVGRFYEKANELRLKRGEVGRTRN